MQSLTTGLRNKSGFPGSTISSISTGSGTTSTLPRQQQQQQASPTNGSNNGNSTIHHQQQQHLHPVGAPISGGLSLNGSLNGSNTIRNNLTTTTVNNNNNTNTQQQQRRRINNKNSNSSSAQSNEFYPRLILYQILSLQCFHYSFLAICFQINHVLYGTSITIDRIFSDKYVSSFSTGWPDALAILITSLAGSFLLAIIVGKSKKCLDFACTLFLVHFLICIVYNGGHIPSKSDWWIVNITGTIMMIVFGEYLCSRRELDDIPLLQI